MPRKERTGGPSVDKVVDTVRTLPRHKVTSFRLPKRGIIAKLERLVAELDDVGEFVDLKPEAGSFVLTIRHR